MLRARHGLLLASILGCSSQQPPAPSNVAPGDASTSDVVGADGPAPDAGNPFDASRSPDAPDGTASLDDPPIPARYQAFATAFDQERSSMGAPGAAVALIEGGKLTFFHGFGTRSPTDSTPVRARSLFRIGSMTKALTATAFLQLVEAGTVSLDATLTSIVPDVDVNDPDLAHVTLRQLMSHQSGLYDYLVVNGPSADSALSSFLTSASFAQNEYFMDPPGTFWDYANPNFYLTGLALERVGGDPYRDAVRKRVLAPLGMTRTFFLPSEVLTDGDYADGISTDATGAQVVEAPDAYDNAWARPAGYAFSSVLDYAKFVQFLNAGDTTVLTDSLRSAMQSPQVDTRTYGDVEGYGFATIVDQGFNLGSSYYATKLVSHGGDIPGFASDFYLVPSTGFGMVSFASKDDAHFQTSVGLALQSFAQLPAPGLPPPGVAVAPSTFASIAGSYYDPHNVGPVSVSVSGGSLVVSMPAVDAAKIPYDPTLVAVSADNFTLAIQGTTLEVTFLRDASGAYAWLRTRVFVAERQGLDGGAPADAGGAADAGDGGGEAGSMEIRRLDAQAFRAALHARL